MIEAFSDQLVFEWSNFIEFLPRLLFAGFILLLFYALGKIVGRLVVNILRKSQLSETHQGFFKNFTVGIFIFIGFIFFLNLIGYSTLAASFVAGGGLTAVMLGFAFKDIGENLLAGFFLAFSRPFNRGDLIETEELTGRVQNIMLRHTHIRTAEGCDIFVPSSQIFTKPLHNYTMDGLRRGGFTVGIDFGDDVQKAIRLLSETVPTIKGVLKNPGPAVQIKGFDPNFVELQIFFWINTRDQEAGLSKIRTAAMDKCRLVLAEAGFTFSSNVSTNIDLSPVELKKEK